MPATVRPAGIYIEGNASCQLRCPTCPTTSGGYPPEVGHGYLRFADFKQLVDDNRQVTAVEFENRGELFLNPDFLKIIEYGHRKGLQMTANGGVNLNDVRPGVLEGLVKYGFRSLLCSLDGATAETYRMYRIGGDFDTVIRHIEEINRHKAAHGSPYPELTWQFVVFGHNEHEIGAARAHAARLGMKFVAKMSWDSGFSPVRDVARVKRETGWTAVTREELEHTTGRNYMRHVCYTLWNNPRINWDGKILGCCWNSWGDFGGNAFRDGYVAASNHEKIVHARAMLTGAAPPRDDIPCSGCGLYRALRDGGDYLTEREVYWRKGRLYRFMRFVYHRVPLVKPLRRLVGG
ncbi:MAG: radical SAM protein [Nitrospirae bacterium]|nr:radical SAM protein [Nitrospirota bacterium]